jgi:YHS domain-containing protein
VWLRSLLILILFWVIARTFWTLLEGVVRGASSPGPQGAGGRSRGGPTPVKMAPCPVCGTYVVPGKAISAMVGGHTEFFCSDKCRDEYRSR